MSESSSPAVGLEPLFQNPMDLVVLIGRPEVGDGDRARQVVDPAGEHRRPPHSVLTPVGELHLVELLFESEKGPIELLGRGHDTFDFVAPNAFATPRRSESCFRIHSIRLMASAAWFKSFRSSSSISVWSRMSSSDPSECGSFRTRRLAV